MVPRPIALDHNFPKPIVQAVARWLPELAFHWIKDLSGDLNLLEDHDLVYELQRRRFPIMVTNNHRMLDDERVLVAIEQTRLTVVAIERAGDDPVLATGVLLRDLPRVLASDHNKGLYFRVRPTSPRPKRARDRLLELGYDDEHVRDSGLPYAERRPYPPNDVRRIR